MDSIFLPVFFAFGGALFFKGLELIELSKLPKAKRPDLTDKLYWIPFIFLPLMGAFVAFAYILSGEKLGPLLAINVGISAPSIIRSVAQVASSDQLKQIKVLPDA
jgi:hypothetical protein